MKIKKRKKKKKKKEEEALDDNKETKGYFTATRRNKWLRYPKTTKEKKKKWLLHLRTTKRENQLACTGYVVHTETVSPGRPVGPVLEVEWSELTI